MVDSHPVIQPLCYTGPWMLATARLKVIEGNSAYNIKLYLLTLSRVAVRSLKVHSRVALVPTITSGLLIVSRAEVDEVRQPPLCQNWGFEILSFSVLEWSMAFLLPAACVRASSAANRSCDLISHLLLVGGLTMSSCQIERWAQVEKRSRMFQLILEVMVTLDSSTLPQSS